MPQTHRNTAKSTRARLWAEPGGRERRYKREERTNGTAASKRLERMGLSVGKG